MENKEASFVPQAKTNILAPNSTRTFAFVIDVIITVIFSLLLFLGLNKAFEARSDVKASYNTFMSYYVDSGLYYDKGDGTLSMYSFDTYKGYENKIYSFYHDYLGNDCPEPKKDYYDVYWYNVFVYGQDDVLNRFTKEEIDNRAPFAVTFGPGMFEFKSSGGQVKYDEFCIPKEGVEAASLLAFYRDDSSQSSTYVIAVTKLTSMDFFLKEYRYYYTNANVIPLGLSFAIGMLIFFYLVTFIFKNGKTIGKRILKISVSDHEGNSLPWWRMLCRFLFTLVISEALFIGLSIVRYSYLLGVIGLIVALIASFICSTINKNQKSFHDLVVDSYVTEDPEKRTISKK